MKQKSIKDNIRNYFFTNPSARLRVRGIERELKLPLPSVIRYCKELEKEGILKTAKTDKVVFYTTDRTNGKYVLEKRLFNIRQIYDSGLVDYIKDALNNPPIVLFGSYAKGEDTEESDIDLYIETPSKKSHDFNKFEKILKRKIQAIISDDITKMKNIHLANNIINGITLNNYIEVFR